MVGISTSGNSENIVRAFDQAHQNKMITVGLTGETGGKMKDLSDHLIAIPSLKTARIQECHIIIGHIICDIVEKELFGNP